MRALPTETKFESGTSHSKSGTFANLCESGDSMSGRARQHQRRRWRASRTSGPSCPPRKIPGVLVRGHAGRVRALKQDETLSQVVPGSLSVGAGVPLALRRHGPPRLCPQGPIYIDTYVFTHIYVYLYIYIQIYMYVYIYMCM